MWSASWTLKWSCLPLSPVVSLHVGGGCWLVWSASWALKWSCLPLSPVVSSCGEWVLVGVAGFWGVVGFLGSEVVLSPVVSGCFWLSPFMWGVGVGWCGRLLGLCEVVLSAVVSPCLALSPVVSLHVGGGRWLVWPPSWALKWSCFPLSPVVSLHVGGGCWLVRSASWALKWSCLPLSPIVSLHVRGGCWLVWSASWALKWSCLPLSPLVSCCLPSCGGKKCIKGGDWGVDVCMLPVMVLCLSST